MLAALASRWKIWPQTNNHSILWLKTWYWFDQNIDPPQRSSIKP